MKQRSNYSFGLADIEIRNANAGGRTICGIAAPFDSPAQIRDAAGSFTEVIKYGAFSRTIAERGAAKVKLLAQHDRGMLPIGRATKLAEDRNGLYGEFRVSKTERGDEVLELIRDGALDAFSIGFRPVRDQWSSDGQTRQLHEIRLEEVSVVAFAAYGAATISAVRQATAPNLAAAQRQLNSLRK